MSDIFVDKKVYPTAESYQFSTEETLSLAQAITCLQGIQNGLKDAEERQAAVVRVPGGWGQGVQVWTKHRRSEIEIRDAQRAVLLGGLQEAIADGTITPDELQEVVARSARA